MKLILGIGLLLAIIIISNADTHVELTGPNVCKTLENYVVEVVVTEQEVYRQREMIWCWDLPPRCPKYRMKFRTVNKTQALPKTRVIKKCCAGYIETKKGDKCEPIRQLIFGKKIRVIAV